VSTRAEVARNRDIREWARENGVDIGDRGPIPDPVREAWAAREGEPVEPVDGDGAEQLPAGDGDQGVRVLPAPPAVAETLPVPPPKRRLWPAKGGAGKGTRRRESLETLVGFAWGGLSSSMARAQRYPTARILQLQAPVAGVIVDDLLKGGIVDRMLQPLARAGKSGEAAFALVGPPLIVELLQRHPERRDILLPMLHAALEQYAEIAGPKLAAAKKRAEKRAAELGAGDIAELIQWLFADPAVGGSDGAAAAA